MVLPRFSLFKKARRRVVETQPGPQSNPVHRLITDILEEAFGKGDAVGVGYREGEIVDAAGREWNAFFEHLEARRSATLSDVQRNDEIRRALAESVELAGPGGRRTVPVWVRKDGRHSLLLSIGILVYACFANSVCERLVSIDGTEESPQPARFIELTPEGEKRRFLEVELSYDERNCFWVRILGMRTEPFSVHVSRSCC